MWWLAIHVEDASGLADALRLPEGCHELAFSVVRLEGHEVVREIGEARLDGGRWVDAPDLDLPRVVEAAPGRPKAPMDVTWATEPLAGGGRSVHVQVRDRGFVRLLDVDFDAAGFPRRRVARVTFAVNLPNGCLDYPLDLGHLFLQHTFSAPTACAALRP